MNLATINDAWNRHVRALEEPKGQDYWQTPMETLALRTGDCEDYAIGKYFSLAVAGLPSNKAKVATVKLDPGPFHCLLIVDGWVLDNFAKEIVRFEARTDIAKVLYQSSLEAPADPRFANMLRRIDLMQTEAVIKKFLERSTGHALGSSGPNNK